MAWSAPMTAVANAVFAAAQFNTYVRDNLLETAPAKATMAGSHFVATGANAIAERLSTGATDNTSCTRTANSYADPNTGNVGPSVTVTTGTKALVTWNCNIISSTNNATGSVGIDVSGATTVAASDNIALVFQQPVGLNSQVFQAGTSEMFTGLTAGSNTFKMVYKSSSGTSTFVRRHMMVFPL